MTVCVFCLYRMGKVSVARREKTCYKHRVELYRQQAAERKTEGIIIMISIFFLSFFLYMLRAAGEHHFSGRQRRRHSPATAWDFQMPPCGCSRRPASGRRLGSVPSYTPRWRGDSRNRGRHRGSSQVHLSEERPRGSPPLPGGPVVVIGRHVLLCDVNHPLDQGLGDQVMPAVQDARAHLLLGPEGTADHGVAAGEEQPLRHTQRKALIVRAEQLQILL